MSKISIFLQTKYISYLIQKCWLFTDFCLCIIYFRELIYNMSNPRTVTLYEHCNFNKDNINECDENGGLAIKLKKDNVAIEDPFTKYKIRLRSNFGVTDRNGKMIQRTLDNFESLSISPNTAVAIFENDDLTGKVMYINNATQYDFLVPCPKNDPRYATRMGSIIIKKADGEGSQALIFNTPQDAINSQVISQETFNRAKLQKYEHFNNSACDTTLIVHILFVILALLLLYYIIIYKAN